MDFVTVEDLIYRAVDAEKARGPAGLSFGPVYSFLLSIAHMARGQERQAIINSLPKDQYAEGRSQDWKDGYNGAVSAFICSFDSTSTAGPILTLFTFREGI